MTYTPTTSEMFDAYAQWRVRELGITDPDRRILASIDALTEFERWQATQHPAGADAAFNALVLSISRAEELIRVTWPAKGMNEAADDLRAALWPEEAR